MKITKQKIPDVFVIEPKIYGDHRGYFIETFRLDIFGEGVGGVSFCQDNESMSSKGILRGLHYQLPPYAQSKLVRVVKGEVLDIAVDIRSGSPTFGQHVSVVLNDINKKQLFVPRGFAHGFVVLSDEAVFCYKVDNYYSAECDRGIFYDDPELNIDWMLDESSIILSEKDKNLPSFHDTDKFNFEKSLYE